MSWNLLILSLPTRNTAARMRAWRALKALGAAVLRDGVYLLPHQPALRQALQAIAADVRSHDGSARLLGVQPGLEDDFAALFDRSAEFAALLHQHGYSLSQTSLSYMDYVVEVSDGAALGTGICPDLSGV